jgi:hypothetical protein
MVCYPAPDFPWLCHFHLNYVVKPQRLSDTQQRVAFDLTTDEKRPRDVGRWVDQHLTATEPGLVVRTQPIAALIVIDIAMVQSNRRLQAPP